MRWTIAGYVGIFVVSFVVNVASQNDQPTKTTAIRTVDFQAMADERDNGRKFSLLRVAFGDLTGDETQEAIVLFRGRSARAERYHDEVWLVEMSGLKPILLAQIRTTVPFEYFLSIESLGSEFRIEDQKIFMDKAFRSKEGKMHYYTAQFNWEGSQMVELKRSISRPLPEEMWEMG